MVTHSNWSRIPPTMNSRYEQKINPLNAKKADQNINCLQNKKTPLGKNPLKLELYLSDNDFQPGTNKKPIKPTTKLRLQH